MAVGGASGPEAAYEESLASHSILRKDAVALRKGAVALRKENAVTPSFPWGKKCGGSVTKILSRVVEAHQRYTARLEEEHREPRQPSQAVTRSHAATWHLGSGSFGDVWLVEGRDSGEQLACKVLERRRVKLRGSQGMIAQEVAVLQELQGRHAGVVQLAGVVETQKTVEILTEFCAGGSLKGHIRSSGRIPEASARVLFRQMASALAFLHSRGIVHRDIKPDNVLLSSPLNSSVALASPHNSPTGLSGKNGAARLSPAAVIAKMADFGSSVKLNPGKTARGNFGTKPFAAPEMAQGLEYGREVDVWSLGLVLYCMLTGSMPGHSARKPRPKSPGSEAGRAWDSLWEDLAKGTLEFSRLALGAFSSEAQDLLAGMLKLDAAQRMTAADVVAHPWLSSEVGPEEGQESRCAAALGRTAFLKEITLETPTGSLMQGSGKNPSLGRPPLRRK